MNPLQLYTVWERPREVRLSCPLLDNTLLYLVSRDRIFRHYSSTIFHKLIDESSDEFCLSSLSIMEYTVAIIEFIYQFMWKDGGYNILYPPTYILYRTCLIIRFLLMIGALALKGIRLGQLSVVSRRNPIRSLAAPDRASPIYPACKPLWTRVRRDSRVCVESQKIPTLGFVISVDFQQQSVLAQEFLPQA